MSKLALEQITIDLENAIGLAFAVEHAMRDPDSYSDVYAGAATILRDELSELHKRLKAYEAAC